MDIHISACIGVAGVVILATVHIKVGCKGLTEFYVVTCLVSAIDTATARNGVTIVVEHVFRNHRISLSKDNAISKSFDLIVMDIVIMELMSLAGSGFCTVISH